MLTNDTTKLPGQKLRQTRASTQEAPSPPTLLVVLGPHRSGTSITARMLECLGAVNSPTLLAARPDNPRGFYECLDIYNFNQNVLLPALGKEWWNVGFVDWGRLNDYDSSRLSIEALELLGVNYPNVQPLSVLKEPRLSWLLPFWQAVFKKAGFKLCFVCVIRHPLSVARSLEARNQLPLAHGAMIYLSSWLSALPHICDDNVAFVHFDDVFSNTEISLTSIAKRFNLIIPEDFSERVDLFKASFLDPALAHYTIADSDLALPYGLPPLATDLYRALKASAEHHNMSDVLTFAKTATSTIAQLTPFIDCFDSMRRHLLDISVEQTTLQTAHEHLEAQRGSLLAERDRLVNERDLLKLSLRERYRELADTTAWLISAEDKAEAAQDELSRIFRSVVWKATFPIRLLFGPVSSAEKAEMRLRRDIHLVKHSRLFDVDYYLAANPDVAEAAVCPIRHYLAHGWREGRRPARFFDTCFYLRNNSDVDEQSARLNPFIHYILHGRAEGRNTC